MSGICLMCLMGIPASGKTTLSRVIKSHLENDNFNVILVCFDSYDGFNDAQSGWKLKRKEIFEDVIKIIDDVQKMKEKRTVIVLDDNMYYRSMRYEYVKLAKSNSLGFCQIYLESDLNKALKLNQTRSNPVPNNIIENIFERIETPNPRRFSWEEKSINLKCDSSFSHCMPRIKDLILSALEDPLKDSTQETDIEKPSQSEIHLADIALRRVISDKVKQLKQTSNNKNELTNVSSALTFEKRNILTALKSGQIILPDHEKLTDMNDIEKIEYYQQFFSNFLFCV